MRCIESIEMKSNLIYKYLLITALLVFTIACGEESNNTNNDENCNPKCETWQSCQDNVCKAQEGRCFDKNDCLENETCNDERKCVAENPVNECSKTKTFEDGLVPTKTIHVSTSGASSNTGTEDSPFATIGQAVAHAVPGTSIVVHSGTYNGSNYISGLSGTKDAPIWIGGASGETKPIIRDTNESMHFVKVSYLIIHNLHIADAESNGINIDDGGDYDNNKATHNVIFRDIEFSNIGTGGNNDCLKLSGVYNFWILNTKFIGKNSGSSGSGIDMVGCHQGIIKGNSFTDMSANGIQAKGGTEDIEIINNSFQNAGDRSINMGGSTGSQFFRPSLSETEKNYEAKDIRVISNLIEGGEASLAFVGCVECLIANNTIINPKNWIFRILQEKKSDDTHEFEPCRDNKVINNIIYFSTDQISTYINIGGNTSPETFTFSNNLWYASNNPAASNPTNIPVTETNGIVGEDPLLDENFKITNTSPAYQKGMELDSLSSDMNGECYLNAPSMGAFEAE